MTSRQPHITADRRLTATVLTACFTTGLAISAASVDLFGVRVLWCWLGLVVLLVCAAAGGLRAGE